MPKITVTGATGQFGGQVIEFLLKRGVRPGELRASVRDVAKAAPLQAQGLDVRRGDFDDPDAVRNAFEDTEHLLIISTDQVGRRVEQHRRAVQAAREAGVKHIAYTSVVDMGQGDLNNPIAADHRATEALIRETGIPFTFLRNTFYAEYMLAPVLQALDQGVFVSNTGEAQLGAAALADLAEAAAVVLSEPGHENKVYELTYPRPWDYREAVEVVSRVSGKPLDYRPVSDDELAQVLQQAGMPADAIQMAVGMNRSLREGNLSKATGDLERVLARPVTSLEELVRQMLAG